MQCEEVGGELASRLVAGGGDSWAGPVAAHLDACADCQAELQALREIWQLLARWPESRPGEEVGERLIRHVRRRLLRESVFTVSGWAPAVLAAVVGVGLSLGLSLLIPYSLLVSWCRQALQVAEAHAGAYLLAGLVYGLPLAAGSLLIARRAVMGAVIGSLEASLLFLLILAPYVIAECREFGPALEVAFVSGLAGGAVVSSLAGLAIARVGSFGRERLSAGGL